MQPVSEAQLIHHFKLYIRNSFIQPSSSCDFPLLDFAEHIYTLLCEAPLANSNILDIQRKKNIRSALLC